MKSIISSLITSLLLVTSLGAVNLKYSEDSSLFVFGTKSGSHRDYIGQGSVYDYQIQDGFFNFRSDFDTGFIDLHFGQKSVSICQLADRWSLELSIPEGIETGNYESLGRYPLETPGFSFFGCGRGCKKLYSNVNILKAEYDDSGVLQTFAANVRQHCEKASNWPTFIAVRYNSDIPVEANTNELYGDVHEPQSFFYAMNHHPVNDDVQFVPFTHFDFASSGLLSDEILDLIKSEVVSTTDRVVMTANDQQPQDRPHHHRAKKNESGFIYYPNYINDTSVLAIYIGKKNKRAVMAFSTSGDYKFRTGLRYYCDPYLTTSEELNFIDFGSSEVYSISGYHVREFEIDEDGHVTNLAIDYVAEGDLGDTSTGSIRYKSKVPVNFRNPCSL